MGHELDRQSDLVAEGEPVGDRDDLAGEEVDGNEVAAEDEEEDAPRVHQLVAALEDEGRAPDEEGDEERDEPSAGQREGPQHPHDRVFGELLPPDDGEGDRGDRERHDEPHRERRDAVGGVREERMDRSEQSHGERSVANLEVHLPKDPATGQLANDERGEEVGDELALAVAADGGVLRGAGPEREHDERHGRGEDPDEHLGSVGDGLRDACTEEGGRRPQGGPQAQGVVSPGDAASSAAGGGPGGTRPAREKLAHHLLERGVLDCEVAHRQQGERAGDDGVDFVLVDVEDAMSTAVPHDATEPHEIGRVDRPREP